MKVVYLYPALAIWGGIERILVDKMNYLVRRYGYEVWMITSDQGQHDIPYDLDEHVHFIDLKIRFHSRYQYKWWRRPFIYRQLSRKYHEQLHKHLQSIQPDVMVCTSNQDVKPLLKVKGKIPLVVESHVNFMHPDTLYHRVNTWINNYWIGKAEAVVTLTNGDAEDWCKVSDHVHVIPNVVNLNDLDQYSDCTARRVLFVGRFEEQKSIGELFSIWQLIHPRFPDWQLDLYGEGVLWNHFKQEADNLGINIKVHEPTRQIMDVYRSSSILVLTSLYEPFGLVIPEAMSCGLPVVAFDCPHGPTTILTERENGFLIPNRDHYLFADRLGKLMSDLDLRQQMGMKAIVSSQRFSADDIMPMWKRLFEELTSLS
ncbi:MAG: glycosyltransferase family 4 protein [Paludibacteraceae bacterium]|nr:glycosyltransferase family 4 protein [Paludibacteraceae bacterium]MBQ8715654.1 glycosyltransferase family 4 protein [Prevotella sp.]